MTQIACCMLPCVQCTGTLTAARTQVAPLVDAVILLRCLLRALPALADSLAWVTTPLLQAVRACCLGHATLLGPPWSQ